MANPEQLSLSACSEDTNSITDEEKIRQLFQVCDNDGDGFIDSNDLAAVCQDLNLEYCLEDLMLALGADQNGKISYCEFLHKRLALKPEIDALRKKSVEYLMTSSDVSLGAGSLSKQECWEFDSGARDLSPEPNTLQRLVTAAGGSSLATSSSGNLLQLANKIHLAALSTLRNEILDLNTRLQNVTEERDTYEKMVEKIQNTSESSLTQQYEEQLTELHCVIGELSRKLEAQKNLVITEEDEFTDTQSIVEDEGEAERNGEETSDEILEKNFESISMPHAENSPGQTILNLREDCANCRALQKENERLKTALETSQQKIQEMKILSSNDVPVMKKAQKIQLRKLGAPVPTFLYSGVSHTQVAEHLVSNVRDECALQDLHISDRKQVEIETEKLHAKLGNIKLQNSMLEMNACQMRTQCERLTTLLGKYESNAIALQLVLDITDKIIKNYKSLLEIQASQDKDTESLLNNIDKLFKERSIVRHTVVKLESYHCTEPVRKQCDRTSDSRKLDLEMAVLMQELLSMREDKAEMRARMYHLETEKEFLEMKLNAIEQKEVVERNPADFHSKNVDENSKALGKSFSKDLNNSSDRDSKDVSSKDFDSNSKANMSEVNKLRAKLKEVSETLERVTRTYELRQMQADQLTAQLKQENSCLLSCLERDKKKSQSRLKRLETEIALMSETHSTQVIHLKQRILSLENKLSGASS